MHTGILILFGLANKGFWAEMLGMGDFYFELSVQIAEICLKTRAQNGGLIEMEMLRELLQQARPGQTIQPYFVLW
jgi:hypothetical protein